jgi:hypothetical protein
MWFKGDMPNGITNSLRSSYLLVQPLPDFDFWCCEDTLMVCATASGINGKREKASVKEQTSF